MVELDSLVVALVENAMIEGEREVVVIAQFEVPSDACAKIETLKCGERLDSVESWEREHL